MIFLPLIFKSIFMELDVAKQPGKQRTKEEIISLVEEYRKTKLSAKDFALSKGVRKATVYYWRKKYGSKQHTQNPKVGFTTLKINPSASSQPTTLFAEVGGIKIYHYVPSSYLKELIG
jgi:hypothetical protein